MEWLQTREARLAIALAIGLLIGTERERRQQEQGAGFAGLRTFALVALLGGLSGYLDYQPWAIAGALVVAAFAIAGHAINREQSDRGITTEVALVVTYVLGVLAIEAPVLAPGVAVVSTWVLALRGELHQLVRRTLTERELRDGLLFLLIALVVLPLAPDENVGPYGAVNPQSLVRLVVVLMAITAAGYLAQRWLGGKLGLAVAGLAAGFVSSSATIAAMAIRAREQPEQWRAAASGAIASSIATVVQYVIVVAAVDPELVPAIAPSMSLAGLVALLGGAVFAWLALRERHAPVEAGRPFRLWVALGFAAVFMLVSVAAAAMQERIGSAGIVLVSSVAALIDAHSTAGSVAALYRARSIDADTALLALLVALSANTLTKIVLAWTSRHVKYGLSVSAGVLFIAAAAWLGTRLG